jgi:hypothetical protein
MTAGISFSHLSILLLLKKFAYLPKTLRHWAAGYKKKGNLNSWKIEHINEELFIPKPSAHTTQHSRVEFPCVY